MNQDDAAHQNRSSPYHAQSLDSVLRSLQVDPQKGLSESDVQKALRDVGPNKLREGPTYSRWKIFFDQFKSVVIIVLAVAGGGAFAFGQWVEGIAITAVLMVNTAIGYLTEYKARRSMAELQAMGGDTIRVLRSGEQEEIDSEDLVPGDIIILEGGDLIPADIRLIESNNLRVNEASLTGESEPVLKDVEPVKAETPLAERKCMLYKGTTITEGSGEGVTVGTGMNTQLGHISELAQSAEKEVTPLQKRLNQLGRRLAGITLVLAVLIAGIGLLAGRETIQMIETAIALGVAAIPEGLPIVATIALARGMYLMARRNGLIKKLPAVETLGATGVIFTDKTGTLTENRMTLRKIKTPAGEFKLEKNQVESRESVHPLELRIIETGVLCNNASLGKAADGDDPEKEQGDPTETALLRAGTKFDISRASLLERMPEEKEVPFNPDLMLMATFHQISEGFRVAVKGAPHRVLEKCSRIATENGQNDQPMKEDLREKYRKQAEELAGEGYRVLGIADKTAGSVEEEPYENLTFLGLVGLHDPPREGVRDSIDECRKAGIRVIMVTGDQAETAKAIAKETHIVDEAEEITVIHGSELKDPDDMSEEDRRRIMEASVFARVTPEQKLHLIKLMQQKGFTVAMTGDGVNDAPALKKADIGVAMGERGTDAARQVADMVLLDDAFDSIVAAVRQGRIIFTNIRKSVMFMLCTNVAEVIIVAVAAAAGTFADIPIPLLPLQILYLNVITDVFPALALGMSAGEPGVMEEKPRPRDESILTAGHWRAIAGWAALVAVCVLGSLVAAYNGLNFETRTAVTVSFLTLAFAKLWFVFNLRKPGSGMLKNDIVRNPFVLGSIVLCTVLLLAAVYLPAISDILKTRHPGLTGWSLLLGMSLLPFIVGQGLRTIQRLGTRD